MNPDHNNEPPPADKNLSLSKPVWVQCKGFRCLAYRGVDGAWHNYSNGELLTEVIGVIPSS